MWLPPSQPVGGSPGAGLGGGAGPGLGVGWVPLDASKVLHSPHWSPHLLVGTVLDARFRLERYMQGCSGAYGHPFQGTELATGQPVFVKVLCGPAHGHGYSVERELETVERLLHMQVRHECLARLRCVLRAATAVKAVTPDCEVAILLNVPAVVSDFYTNGDLFDALFKPQVGGKLAAPRAMPEAIARNYMWQIVTAVSCMHAQHHFHRDLKPENVMFDASYNIKVTDFGACAFVPLADVLQQPRTLTGIHVDPGDDRAWRIGTEAYAPPEIFYPGAEGYDVSKFDVWSLGCILFVMLLVDVLDIIQVSDQDGMSKRTTLRMPFMSYNCVTYPLRNHETGACANLVHQLDDPPVSFTGELCQAAPTNERFWRHFPKAAQRLSPQALDLLNRMLVKHPDQRIELGDVQRHPWMEMQMPSKEDVRHEMAQRAPTGREIEGDQRIVLVANNEWISLGELRRSLRGGPAAAVPFPKDHELASAIISCGPVGSSDYRAVWMFTALSQFLNSLGVAVQNFSKRLLSLSCVTPGLNGQVVEQFVAQVLNIRGEVLILLLPGLNATEFAIWNDRIRMFARNQASLLQIQQQSAAAGGGLLDQGGRQVSGDGAQDTPTTRYLLRHGGCDITNLRNVRPRLTEPGAVKEENNNNGTTPSASAAAPARPPTGRAQHTAGGGLVPGGGAGTAAGAQGKALSTSGGQAQCERDIDWSWPPLDPADRGLAEMTFDHQIGVPRGGCLWLTRFLDFCDVRDGIPRIEAEAVWTLVVPSGIQAMNKEQFVRARYILKGLSEGRAMPPRFPEHVFGEARSLRPDNQLPGALGTLSNPIRYDYFAYLFRPTVEEEYRRRQTVYRKTSPVVVLCEQQRSPFSSRLGSLDVDKFLLCNMGAQLDTWHIKETNFLENYHVLPGPGLLSHECLTAEDGGAKLREEVHEALSSSPVHLAWLPTWSPAEWEALRTHLLSEKERESRDAGANSRLAWRLALPRNHVIAVRLTDELLASCLANMRIAYRPGSVLYREETYQPYVRDFRAGDYVVSDVSAAGTGAFFSHATTHDRAWVWKLLNKVCRGQTLITRTISGATFQATYKELRLDDRQGDSRPA